MVGQPGPRQVFNNVIKKISFPSVGGLVFLRVSQHWTGNAAPPAAKAQATGLPSGWGSPDWSTAGSTDGVDPSATPGSVPIVNPVSDKMLAKYRWWLPVRPAHDQKTVTTPGIDVFIVDTANWNEIYDHVVTARLTPVWTRDQALTFFKTPPFGLLDGQDPNLVGVGIFTNTFQTVEIPSPTFFSMAASGGWTYHVEPGAPATGYQADDATVILLNLGKLYASLPKNPQTGKKPATFTFTIGGPTTPGNGTLKWKVEGAAYKSRLTPANQGGPKADERRDYPLKDTAAGTTTPAEYHVPDWTPWPQTGYSNDNVTGVVSADVKITFGAGKTAPQVEITGAAGGGGPAIG